MAHFADIAAIRRTLALVEEHRKTDPDPVQRLMWGVVKHELTTLLIVHREPIHEHAPQQAA